MKYVSDEPKFEHTVGSHSDDRGGDSDRRCDCQDDKPQSITKVELSDIDWGLIKDDMKLVFTAKELKAYVERERVEARIEMEKTALCVADYWINEDGRPKHLMLDLQEIRNFDAVDWIGNEYRVKYGLAQLKKGKE
jgi:hypothetical protein